MPYKNKQKAREYNTEFQRKKRERIRIANTEVAFIVDIDKLKELNEI